MLRSRTARRTSLVRAASAALALAALIGVTGCASATSPSAEPSASIAPEAQSDESNDVTDPTEQNDADPHAAHGEDAAPAEPGPNEVITIGLRFTPPTITVPVGTTVTWRNGEAIGHTITSGVWGDVNETTGLRGSQEADGMFRHALARAGEEGDTFSFTFTEPGEYPYFCEPHLTMNASVIVEAAG